MAEHIRMEGRSHDGRPGALGELIHTAVRRAIEVAVDLELTTALGASRYARCGSRCGYRNGTKPRTLTGPTGPVALTVPRATVFTSTGSREWSSALLPRYQRRLREVNEAVVATYLAGGNSRRLRGALAPLLKAAPLSKSAVSRVVGTLKVDLEVWRTRSLTALDVLGLYLDALALRVRRAGKVVSVPVLGVVAVLTDGQKQLLALELCPGGETFEAWRACLTDLGNRGLVAPVWCVIDGHPGLRKAVGLVWPQALVQRCAVHKLRNLERKAPKHALAEIRADFHHIVYADSAGAAHTAFTAFERKWSPRCPGVVRSPNRAVRDPTALASHVCIPGTRRGRRPYLLRAELRGHASSCRVLCGQDPEGDQGWRPTGRATDDVRNGHQPEGRQDARAHDPAVGAGPRGPGHSVTQRPLNRKVRPGIFHIKRDTTRPGVLRVGRNRQNR
jgi:transposase-like protein